MAQSGGVNGIAVAAIATGALFTYAGVTGKGAFATLQSVIRGQNPTGVPQTASIAGAAQVMAAAASAAVAAQAPPIARAGGGAAAGGQPVPGQATQPSAFTALAAAGLRYIGAGYQFGGAPVDLDGTFHPGRWDCSSFLNWCAGHDVGLAIPLYRAGSYTGTTHGPTAIMWQAWTGATTIGRRGADAQPGDLCCWQTHVGIAIGGGQMVSARNPRNGTGISTIDTGGPAGEILTIRRINGSG